MSRNGSGVYSLPAGYLATTGNTIQPAQHNDPLEDLETDMNTARPIVAGGTGATSAYAARVNLKVTSYYTTRAAFKTAIAASELTSLSDGDMVMADGVVYVKNTGSTYISDINDFDPYGTLSYAHFNNTGTTGTVTLNITNYSEYSAVKTFLEDLRIAAGTFVKIAAADATYAGVLGTWRHPDGAQIYLTGNTSTPSSVTFESAGSTPGLYVEGGFQLGGGSATALWDGFRILRTTRATSSDTSGGIIAQDGSQIHLGSNVEVEHYYYGVSARQGAYIQADGISVTEAGDVAIGSNSGGLVEAANATVTDANDSANGFGSGFMAESGGQVRCQGATATDCYFAGFHASTGGHVHARDCTADTCADTVDTSGFKIRNGGTMVVVDATADSCSIGLSLDNGGTVTGLSSVTFTSSAVSDTDFSDDDVYRYNSSSGTFTLRSLDDTGSFNVLISDSSGNSYDTGVTANYAQIGSEVRVWFNSVNNIDTVTDSLVSGDNLRISLPIAATARSVGQVIMAQVGTMPTGSNELFCRVLSGNAYANIVGTNPTGTPTIMKVSDLTSGTTDIIDFQLTYRV